MKRGQVSLEYLVAFFLILIVFISVLTFTSPRNELNEELKRGTKNAALCNKLSLLFSSLASSNKKTEVTVSVTKDVNIFGGSINIEDYYCYFLGEAEDVNLLKGDIKATYEDGIITVENV